MGDSFLGRVSPQNIQSWLSAIEENKTGTPNDLDRVDQFFTRWIMGALEIKKIHDFEDISTTHIKTYLCKNKKQQEFIILKVKTEKPAYTVVTCPFDISSVYQALKKNVNQSEQDNPITRP
jgi:hypothetical protein